MGLKALTAILTIGRRSKKHVDWTLAIAILSTIVTVALFALYFLQDRVDFP
jgi:low temperature requirement protein LtrA